MAFQTERRCAPPLHVPVVTTLETPREGFVDALTLAAGPQLGGFRGKVLVVYGSGGPQSRGIWSTIAGNLQLRFWGTELHRFSGLSQQPLRQRTIFSTWNDSLCFSESAHRWVPALSHTTAQIRPDNCARRASRCRPSRTCYSWRVEDGGLRPEVWPHPPARR